jgi:hypothetical protein
VGDVVRVAGDHPGVAGDARGDGPVSTPAVSWVRLLYFLTTLPASFPNILAII